MRGDLCVLDELAHDIIHVRPILFHDASCTLFDCSLHSGNNMPCYPRKNNQEFLVLENGKRRFVIVVVFTFFTKGGSRRRKGSW
jgi:hypothetical protein